VNSKRTAALVLLLVFVSGVFAGAGLVRTALASGPPPAPLPGLETLDLNSDQIARARVILDRHRAELEAVLAGVEPQLRPVRDRVEFELRREVLTDAQGKQLDRVKVRGGHPNLPSP
jgi:hypothetical protein